MADTTENNGEFALDKDDAGGVYWRVETFNESALSLYHTGTVSKEDSGSEGGTLKTRTVVGLLALAWMTSSCFAQTSWQRKVDTELPLMGHRNWIVIVDSAYPLESSSGVESIDTGADQLQVLDYVLGAIKNSKHVRPLAHEDAELQYIPESEAPGVEQYRKELKARLQGIPTDRILHQTLIDRLNELGKDFHVLVLKTNMTIPYTSVFLQLDCKYWSAESEARLRERMKTPAVGAASK